MEARNTEFELNEIEEGASFGEGEKGSSVAMQRFDSDSPTLLQAVGLAAQQYPYHELVNFAKKLESFQLIYESNRQSSQMSDLYADTIKIFQEFLFENDVKQGYIQDMLDSFLIIEEGLEENRKELMQSNFRKIHDVCSQRRFYHQVNMPDKADIEEGHLSKEMMLKEVGQLEEWLGDNNKLNAWDKVKIESKIEKFHQMILSFEHEKLHWLQLRLALEAMMDQHFCSILSTQQGLEEAVWKLGFMENKLVHDSITEIIAGAGEYRRQFNSPEASYVVFEAYSNITEILRSCKHGEDFEAAIQRCGAHANRITDSCESQDVKYECALRFRSVMRVFVACTFILGLVGAVAASMVAPEAVVIGLGIALVSALIFGVGASCSDSIEKYGEQNEVNQARTRTCYEKFPTRIYRFCDLFESKLVEKRKIEKEKVEEALIQTSSSPSLSY